MRRQIVRDATLGILLAATGIAWWLATGDFPWIGTVIGAAVWAAFVAGSAK